MGNWTLSCAVTALFQTVMTSVQHYALIAQKVQNQHFEPDFIRYRITFHAPIAFLNPVQKKHSRVCVLTRNLENSPVTLFRAKIISLPLINLLFSLFICQSIDQLHLHLSHSIIKARFGSVSYRITMFTCETKRYGL